MSTSPDITQLLRQWNAGDEQARDALVPLLYDEFKLLARARVRRERAGHTLDTTGLVHEAYLRLADLGAVQWNDRGHFLALASRVMRNLLVNYATMRQAQKRGGVQQRVDLDDVQLVSEEQAEAVLELEEALGRMEALHPRPAQAVAHCYFGGLTNDEAADVMGVSRATIERDLRCARAWLGQALGNRARERAG